MSEEGDSQSGGKVPFYRKSAQDFEREQEEAARRQFDEGADAEEEYEEVRSQAASEAATQVGEDAQRQSARGDVSDAPSAWETNVAFDPTATPGFTYSMLGRGVPLSPAAWQAGGHVEPWIPWQDAPLPLDPCPIRITNTLQTDICNLNPGAQNLSDLAVPENPAHRAQVIAYATLLGMAGIGTAKGYRCGSHANLDEMKASGASNIDIDKAKKEMDGNISEYVMNPFARDGTIPNGRAHARAPMFAWTIEALYGPCHERVVGIRTSKLVFDRTHSDDELQRRAMGESLKIQQTGSLNGCQEDLRTEKGLKANKSQRSMMSDPSMQCSGLVRWRSISNIQQYRKILMQYRGLYGNFDEIHCNAMLSSLREDPTEGGYHPFGPSVATNFKRERSETHNVLTAGMFDAAGNPIEICAEQANYENYFVDEDCYEFKPPDFVLEKGAFFVCWDPNELNIASIALPLSLQGRVSPERPLLKLFYEMHKDKDPRLIAAANADPPRDDFESAEKLIQNLFESFYKGNEQDITPLQEAVIRNPLVTSDTLDKTAMEVDALRSGTAAQIVDDEMQAKTPYQVLKEIQKMVTRVNGLIKAWKTLEESKIQQLSTVEEQKAGQVKLLDAYEEAMDASMRMGLEMYKNAFASKSENRSIPHGWRTIYKGMMTAIREIGEMSKRPMNPEDPRSKTGTMNVAFAFKHKMTARDKSPYGHWQTLKMNFLSDDVKISGKDTAPLQEFWLGSLETVLPKKFFEVWLGGPGTGKSVRQARAKSVWPEGFVVSGGRSTDVANMNGENGGLDSVCGHVRCTDELPVDFSAEDSKRQEFYKTKSMEAEYAMQRTKRVQGLTGEEFKTDQIIVVREEKEFYNFNGGPSATPAGREPSEARMALLDRTGCHIIFAAEDKEQMSDEDFQAHLRKTEVRMTTNKFRLIWSVTAFINMYIRNAHAFQPDISYAKRLCREWDEMLSKHYGQPTPDKRKVDKRNQQLLAAAVEAAVAEAFMTEESAANIPEMIPNEKGELAPFEIEQLVPIIKNAQRCLDFEVILNIWSHSLNWTFATTDYAQEMKTVLAMMHGHKLDCCKLTDKNESDSGAPSNASNEPMQQLGQSCVESFMHGDGLTREQCKSLAEALEEQRVMRHEYSRRMLNVNRSGDYVHQRSQKRNIHEILTKWMSDSHVGDSPKTRHPITDMLVDAAECAGSVMPLPQDVVGSGYNSTLIKSALDAEESNKFTGRLGMFGICDGPWCYLAPTQEDRGLMRHTDLQWKTMQAPRGGAAPSAAADGKRTVWQSAAKYIINMYGDTPWFRLSLETVRDCLFLLSLERPDNCVNIGVHTQTDREDAFNLRMISPEGTFWAPEEEPRTVLPQFTRDTNGGIDAAFQNAERMPRTHKVSACISADNERQGRLDYLVTRGVLPACRVPISFQKGAPVRAIMDQSGSGFAVSATWAAAHANLVVEASVYLTQLPGVMGSQLCDGPDSFANDSSRPQKRARTAAPADEVDRQGSSVLKDRVEDPDSTMPNDLHAEPGVSRKAEAMRYNPDTHVERTFYGYNMLSMFFTMKMAETLSMSRHTQAKAVQAEYGMVFTETEKEMLENLPVFTSRFPAPAVPDTCAPLCKRPVEKSTFNVNIVSKGKKRSIGATQYSNHVHSVEHGRHVGEDDDLVKAHRAAREGRHGLESIDTNFLDRASWCEWTKQVSLERGIVSAKEDLDAIDDQGCFFRLRVRQAWACDPVTRDSAIHLQQDPSIKHLSASSPEDIAENWSFEAYEAKVRKDAANPNQARTADGAGSSSSSKKRFKVADCLSSLPAQKRARTR